MAKQPKIVRCLRPRNTELLGLMTLETAKDSDRYSVIFLEYSHGKFFKAYVYTKEYKREEEKDRSYQSYIRSLPLKRLGKAVPVSY